MATPGALDIIQATLAPAFLMTGGGIFLNFVQARLFRVNDRIRNVACLAEAERLRHRHEIRLLLRRGRLLRNAIVFGVGGLAFVVLTMVALLASVLLAGLPSTVIVVTFAVALASFTVAFVVMAVDTVLSFRSLAAEFEGSDVLR